MAVDVIGSESNTFSHMGNATSLTFQNKIFGVL